MINANLEWKSLILAQFSAEPHRGEQAPSPQKSHGSYYYQPQSQFLPAWFSLLISFFPYLNTAEHEYECNQIDYSSSFHTTMDPRNDD